MNGSHVFDVLDAQGRYQRWFAGQLGIDDTYVSLLKSGKRPWTPELMERASQILNIPAHVLFFDDGSRARDDDSRNGTSEGSAA